MMVIKRLIYLRKKALASGANYLKKIGWNNKIHWGEKINIKINKELQKISLKKFKDIKYWESYGINLKINTIKNQLMRLVIPDSQDNQYFLVSKNFDIILDWNDLTILL